MAANYRIAKYMGDDLYSWAVFKDGRPVDTGLSRTEARYLKKRLEREDAAR